MEIAVRVASLEDLDCLVQLIIGLRDVDAVEDEPSEESLRRDVPQLLREESTEFFIAGSGDDRCLGFVQQRYRYNLWILAPEAYVEDLFVLDHARGQGVGQRLVEFAMQRAQDRGCPLISLDTTERNQRAIRLYERLGFSLRSPRSGLRLLLRRWIGAGPAPWQSYGDQGG